mmetsp:Transcript_4686/g.11492  ORF Transcript_4686/g.11492 Transcript_4686/m.11492 type:complete len:287 (-) Transcript_4686:318-1178(-)
MIGKISKFWSFIFSSNGRTSVVTLQQLFTSAISPAVAASCSCSACSKTHCLPSFSNESKNCSALKYAGFCTCRSGAANVGARLEAYFAGPNRRLGACIGGRVATSIRSRPSSSGWFRSPSSSSWRAAASWVTGSTGWDVSDPPSRARQKQRNSSSICAAAADARRRSGDAGDAGDNPAETPPLDGSLPASDGPILPSSSPSPTASARITSITRRTAADVTEAVSSRALSLAGPPTARHSLSPCCLDDDRFSAPCMSRSRSPVVFAGPEITQISSAVSSILEETFRC